MTITPNLAVLAAMLSIFGHPSNPWALAIWSALMAAAVRVFWAGHGG